MCQNISSLKFEDLCTTYLFALSFIDIIDVMSTPSPHFNSAEYLEFFYFEYMNVSINFNVRFQSVLDHHKVI